MAVGDLDKCEQDVLGHPDSWTAGQVDTNGTSWSAHAHVLLQTSKSAELAARTSPGGAALCLLFPVAPLFSVQLAPVVVAVVVVVVLVVVFILSLKTLVKSAPGHSRRATQSDASLLPGLHLHNEFAESTFCGAGVQEQAGI